MKGERFGYTWLQCYEGTKARAYIYFWMLCGFVLSLYVVRLSDVIVVMGRGGSLNVEKEGGL
jgi:hypothetical protein